MVVFTHIYTGDNIYNVESEIDRVKNIRNIQIENSNINIKP